MVRAALNVTHSKVPSRLLSLRGKNVREKLAGQGVHSVSHTARFEFFSWLSA